MNGDGGVMKYNYEGIRGLLDQIQSQHQKLTQINLDLDDVRKKAQGLWDDKNSAEAFQATYQKWVEGANEVQGVLHAIVNAAQHGATSMEETNNTIAAGWNS
ncbi:WXG100 family type VII secretion target [Williamsia sp. CHRR-6]|uniref:WXG100 family type VII secretion target n=1 Tax=Williamsia sp. CHRR-6 TaxID=2835871 RepID=UPI001BD9FF89|nr:WXG100 family type VII secretion target [Williamsia sp. CHRR-6]MBT0568579.1 WXG100 family type VII secretion target [Williamsia sp. CHRR-6]